MARPAEVLNWARAASGTGRDGRFEIGVFMVRKRLGKYQIEFLPLEKYRTIIQMPGDEEARQRFLKREYDNPTHAEYVAEGMAEAMLERVPKTGPRETGDNIVDSIEQLLRANGGKMSKAEILARLHFTEAQWTRFLEMRPSTIELESHGRGARYYIKTTAQKAAPGKTFGGGFDSYIGQPTVIARMRKYVESARKRQQALDHVLLSGPPGVGKTTLAQVIAKELGRPLHAFWAHTLDVSELRGARPLDIVFIDEIHALPANTQEQLFAIMKQGVTIIGATNFPARLTSALRDRFAIKEVLEMYSPDDLARILANVASSEKTSLPDAVGAAIAQRSRGSAREAISLLHRIRDLGGLSPKEIKAAFRALEVDDLGLNKQDRRYLSILAEVEEAIGLEALATKLGESPDTVENNVEPFLLQIGLIERTGRGRRISDKGRKHLQSFERKERRAPKAEPSEPTREAEPANETPGPANEAREPGSPGEQQSMGFE